MKAEGVIAWAGLILAASVLASCATRVTLPPLPDCHPANAAAPSAERARPSDLLDRTAPVPAAEPEAMEPMEGMEGTEEMEPMEEMGEPDEMEREEEMEGMEGHEHHEMHPPPPPPPTASGGAAP